LIEACVKYLKYSERYSKKTIQKKKYICKRILESWGKDTDLLDITPEKVQAFLDARARTKSNHASNEDRKNMLTMFNYVMRILGINHNPVAITQSRSHDVASQYTPPEVDVLRLIAAASPDEKAFLTCYLSTGARRSEIFRLTWDDINFEAGTIRLGTRKTRDGSMKYRILPMNTTLADALSRRYKSRDKKVLHIFTSKAGKPYTTRRRFMPGLCDRAGVRPFGFHALRRYVASILSDKHKVSSKAIQQVLGHQSQATTERYLQKIHTGMAEVMNLLDDPLQNTLQNNLQEGNK